MRPRPLRLPVDVQLDLEERRFYRQLARLIIAFVFATGILFVILIVPRLGQPPPTRADCESWSFIG